MTEQEQRATVTVLRGHGEERLRQAIMQGLVREDLQGDFNEVLQRLDSMRRDLNRADELLAHERASYERFKKLYGVMSVEFANAIANDSVDDRVEAEVAQNANGQPIVLPTGAAPALEAALVPEAAAPAASPAAAVVYDEDMDPGF